MSLDFQAEPFFDDYSEDKQFYQILFRPGYAVQARELNQLQTILSQQIKRHGDHMFKEGAMIIPGQISYDLDVNYVRLDDSTGVNYDPSFKLIDGRIIKNQLSSPVLARVVATSNKEGQDSSTIYIRYLSSGTDNFGNSVPEFTSNDTLTLLDGTSLPVTLRVANQDTVNFVVTDKSSIASMQRGVYYIRGKFVLAPTQTIILDKYSNTPSYRIGLQLTESVIYPEDDETLLDNALGSPNYAAPGAARHYIDLILTKIPLSSTDDTDFVDLLRLRNGKVLFQVTRTEYAELEKTLARRTFDESGDYALNPFVIKPREYRSNFRGPRGKGINYIRGDVIRVPRSGSFNTFDYFVATNNGESSGSDTSDLEFPSNPSLSSYYAPKSDGTVIWEATTSPVFNDGVNQFFSDNIEFEDFTVEDHTRLASMTIYSIEPNKAYVKGYEIEKVATEYIPSFKSRDIPEGSPALAQYFGVDSLPAISNSVSSTQTASIDLSFGSYVIAKELLHAPDLVNFTTVNLYNSEYTYGNPGEEDDPTTAPTGVIIGTARVRAVQLHDDKSGTANDEYKVFLFDIKMNAEYKFSDVKSIYGDGTKFKCNLITSGGIAVLNDANKVSLIYQIPDYAIKNIESISYSASYVATWNNAAIEPPTGFAFDSSVGLGNYYVIDNATGLYVNATVDVSGAGGELNLTGVSGAHTVICTVKTSVIASYSTRLEVKTAILNITKDNATRIYTLGHPKVRKIESILMAANATNESTGLYTVDITNRFELNSQQYESHSTNSTIRLLDSQALPDRNFQVVYEYIAPFSSDNAGSLFSVNSYINAETNIAYEDIPVFGRYNLRDSLDFRPYTNDSTGSTYRTRLIPKYGTTAIVTYKKYFPRTDNLCLTDRGEYLVSYGVPNANPLEPAIPSNAMKLAIVDVEPYTFSTRTGLTVTRIDNKRYTMRDIGKLENRIKSLEYYTSLSLLESDTNGLKITDSDGIDRFQSGFLVDSFSGQGIGNTASEEWNASIDHKNKELRPFFAQRQVNMLEVFNAGGTYQYKVNGDIITAPRASTPEVAMISQTRASRTISVNPFDVATFRGLMYLNPWSDTWFATDRRPDIVINDDGQYNAVVAKAEADGVLGTVWNAWQVIFQGEPVTTGSRLDVIASAAQGNRFAQVDSDILNANNGFGGTGSLWRARTTFTAEELNAIGITDGRLSGSFSNSVAGSRVVTIETDAVEVGLSRQGQRTFIQDKVDSRVVDDRVVETQIIPYIRPRSVLFNAKGLKPTTDVNAFFDGIKVNQYIEKAKVIAVQLIGNNGFTFDVDRNCGTRVSDTARKVQSPSYGVGTISVTNGSNAVEGTATAFVSEFPNPYTANSAKIIIGGDEYTVASIDDNDTLTLSSPYVSPTAGISTYSDLSYQIKINGVTNDEVEIAFTHGEVITGNTSGATAVVVGQEIQRVTESTSNYYLHILNIKGNFAPNETLIGEYSDTPGNNGVKPQVKFLNYNAAQNKKLDDNKIKTSFTGQLHGLFKIPNNPIDRFKTGVRELTFTDKDSAKTQGNTDARAYYEANGLLEIKQRTIVSTRTAELAIEQLDPEENRIIQTTDRLVRDTGWFDPLAQTFLVQEEGGAFLSSVDIFFSAKDENIPVRIEVREVVNGYPGQKVLPFSRVQKSPAEVFTSGDASVPTKFTFVSPVYVQEYTEYALVILSDSARYFVHISRSGETDYKGNIISGQPYNGVFFTSQNASTWTAAQEDDLLFTLNKAQFQTGSYKVKLATPRLARKNLDFNPFYFREGSNRVRVSHRNHGFKLSDIVKFSSRQQINSIDRWTYNEIFNANGHTILSVEEDSYVIELPVKAGGASATGRSGGAFIYATENYEFSTAMLNASNVTVAGTDIKYKLITTKKESVSTRESFDVINNENFNFEEPMIIRFGEENSDLILEAELSTTNPNLTPTLDTGRIAITMVNNKVDLPTTKNASVEELDTITLLDPTTLTTEAATDTKIKVAAKSLTVLNTYTSAYNNLNQLRIGSTVRFSADGAREYFVASKYTESAGGSNTNLVIVFADIVASDGYEYIEDIDLTSFIPDGDTEIESVKIDWLSHYTSEIAPFGGSTTSKYVTKKVNLARSSDLLRIMFSAIVPNEAEIDVYYKVGQSTDSELVSSRYFRATPTTPYSKSNIKYSNAIYDIEGLEPFTSIVVKLVMRSTKTSKVPRIKDLRIIACAV